jgi:hypothetical protein
MKEHAIIHLLESAGRDREIGRLGAPDNVGISSEIDGDGVTGVSTSSAEIG